MLIRKLFRTAWSYRAQFLSMIIMVAIGVGIFLGFNIEWKSLETDTNAFFAETHYADFRLYDETGFSKEDIAAIAEISSVDAATRYLAVNAGIKDTKKSLSLNISEDYNVSTMYIMEGTNYDAESDDIWLSDKFAEKNSIAIGDTLELVYMGMDISGEVVGLIIDMPNKACQIQKNMI